MNVIKGCPRDKWAEVQAIQHQPFIYIHHNGSKWAGEEPDDVQSLLDCLKAHRFNAKDWDTGFTDNPCEGIYNPDFQRGGDQPQWIDGPRMYACDAVRFSGNFEDVSHGFCIDTNHAPTISALKSALAANIARHKKAA